MSQAHVGDKCPICTLFHLWLKKPKDFYLKVHLLKKAMCPSSKPDFYQNREASPSTRSASLAAMAQELVLCEKQILSSPKSP